MNSSNSGGVFGSDDSRNKRQRDCSCWGIGLMMMMFFLVVLPVPVFASSKTATTVTGEEEEEDASATTTSSNRNRSRELKRDTDVIIGGAGFAGITAAQELNDYGVQFIILEASDLVGGRARCENLPDLQDDSKSYALEMGPNWISGGEGNPIFQYKLETKLQGFLQQSTTNLYNVEGKVVAGDYETEWDTKFNDIPVDTNIATKMDKAYWKGERLSQQCLQLPADYKLTEKEQKFCNQLCIGLVKGKWFDKLKITDATICDEDTGQFVPGNPANELMSVTDLMRAANGFYPPQEDDVCAARLADYFYQDADMGDEPWKTSAKSWFVSDTWIEFEPIDFFLLDDRCFSFIAEYQGSQFLSTSTKTKSKIVFDDDRLKFSSKITKVEWDPNGNKDVIITYCKTKRVEAKGKKPHLFPCIDGSFETIRAKEFISTFSWGVLRKALKLEKKKNKNNYVDQAPVFVPPLSSLPAVAAALDFNPMAHVTKVYLQFPFKFWPDKEFLLTPWSVGKYTCDYNAMWSPVDIPNYYPGSKIMYIYTTGKRAVDLARLTNNQIIKQMLPTLNNYFAKKIEKGLRKMGIKNRKRLVARDVKNIFVTRWSQDPLYRGCWVTESIGATKKQHYDVARRYGNLVFSGEHTCFRHAGYTHGAQFAGTRSARELLRDRYGETDIDVKTLCDYKPEEL